MYVEIFLLLMFVSKRREIKKEGERDADQITVFPEVTIVVPCFNEEKTVGRTIASLLALDYPKEKLNIIIVDDGSKDNTWNVISEYTKQHPHIEAVHKENGGKYTALNFGIEKSTTPFLGCLDADSFVDPKTLKKIMRQFQDHPEVMAVTPAIRIHSPSTIVQMAQSAEYYLAILAKKVQSFLGAIHVTPGPFTIFRREVFEKIGPFRHAHNLEDMEMAFRMQKNGMMIDNVHNAWVYTVGPNTFIKLYKQRLRWTHGFLENARDYKELFFNPKYGNVSFLTLPSAFLFIIAVIFTIFFLLWRWGNFVVMKFIQWRTVGFVYPQINLDWFYVSTRLTIVLSAIVFILTVLLMINAHKMVEGKFRLSKNFVVYMLVYPIVSPLWILKSIYHTITSKKTNWR
jgi:cellulose synthase/poly-beta-1,6-N-acetylglucosamine synthase-like glycosyltransferase